jgi:N,N'-diacetyllegionaminate synthase
MSNPNFSIAGRRIGPGAPCFVIAEAGVNHNGDLERALRLVDVAAEAGADAVKFQTFKADRLVTRKAAKADYQIRQTGAAESQFDMLRRLELSEENHRRLQTHAAARGVLFMSTPFDEESADLLEHLNVAVFKLPSGEITNLPLLQHVARKGKPMVVSTGMASLGEVEAAVQTIEETGNDQFVLLHCVSQYPADPADVNLRAMQTLALAFAKPVGYSDHTLGNEIALAAVVLGACVIEKHYTLDRGLPGPDHAASSEPGELTALIKGIRKIESALGQGRKQAAASEASTAAVARKSLVASRDIPAGAILTMDLIAIKRPGTGLPPALRPALIGRTARKNIPADTLLTMDMVA